MAAFFRLIMVFLCLQAGPTWANNPSVGPGEAGYIYWNPILGIWYKGGFVDVIIGPKKYGYRFRHFAVQRINIRSQTFDEEFQVVDVNQIKIHFEVHFTMKPDVNRIKDLVEQYAGADWYTAVARQPLRTFVRDAIGIQDSQTLSTSQDKVQVEVTDAVNKWLAEKDLPIVLEQVSVGNFQFPEEIATAAAEKQANLQRLAAKATQLEIAKKDAEIVAAQAEGVRRSQDIINETLTPIYVQHEMVRAIEAVASKAGNVVVYVPIGPNGLPLVGAMDMKAAQVQEHHPDTK